MSNHGRINITKDDLAEFRRQAEASTPVSAYGTIPNLLGTIEQIADSTSPRPLWTVYQKCNDGDWFSAITGNGLQSEANAQFYSNAAMMVLSLLDRVGELEMALAEEKAGRERAQKWLESFQGAAADLGVQKWLADIMTDRAMTAGLAECERLRGIIAKARETMEDGCHHAPDCDDPSDPTPVEDWCSNCIAKSALGEAK